VIQQRSNNLSINNSKIGKWKLTEVSVGLIIQPLTISQSSFVKQYTSDGKFSDSDGLKGTWNVPVQDSLVESYINFGTSVTVTQRYFISNLTSSQLILNYVVNGTNISTSYTAIP
jgi:sucrose-6-phosphate hydrolase SacC (GH32 family)